MGGGDLEGRGYWYWYRVGWEGKERGFGQRRLVA